MTFIRRCNVKQRCIDVEATLHKRHVSAGHTLHVENWKLIKNSL